MTHFRRSPAPSLRASLPVGPPRGVPAIEMAATVVSFAWLGLVGWFFVTIRPEQAAEVRSDPTSFMIALLGLFMPIALIWVAASTARTARTVREEAERLHAAVDALRRAQREARETEGTAMREAVEGRLETVLRAQSALGAEMAAMRAAQDGPERVLRAPAREDASPTLSLPLDEDAPPAPLPPEDFIRAVNFPENDRDAEGFAVLRRALSDHRVATLIQAAQELLTLLAQDGIYVDDLSPHRAPPATWRAFAAGARGDAVAALAGVRDRSSLALTAGRMKDDSVFRDAVHAFLRAFDAAFADFAEDATDAEIIAFADTRTARAFMLTGRVAGTLEG